jgi:hypothetical protein
MEYLPSAVLPGVISEVVGTNGYKVCCAHYLRDLVGEKMSNQCISALSIIAKDCVIVVDNDGVASAAKELFGSGGKIREEFFLNYNNCRSRKVEQISNASDIL